MRSCRGLVSPFSVVTPLSQVKVYFLCLSLLMPNNSTNKQEVRMGFGSSYLLSMVQGNISIWAQISPCFLTIGLKHPQALLAASLPHRERQHIVCGLKTLHPCESSV